MEVVNPMKKIFIIILSLAMLFSISAVAFAAAPTTDFNFTVTTDYITANHPTLAVTNMTANTANITVDASQLIGYQNAKILLVSSNGKTMAISNVSIGKETKTYTVPKKIGTDKDNSAISTTAYLVLGDKLYYTVSFMGHGDRFGYGRDAYYNQQVQEGQPINWAEVEAHSSLMDMGYYFLDGTPCNYDGVSTVHGWLGDGGNPYYLYDTTLYNGMFDGQQPVMRNLSLAPWMQ
jgi:uncharacterized protein YxeA